MSQGFWPIFSILEENKKKKTPPQKTDFEYNHRIQVFIYQTKVKIVSCLQIGIRYCIENFKKFLLKILKIDGQNCKSKYLLFKYGEYRL